MRSLPLGTALFLALLAGCSTTDHPAVSTSMPSEKIRFVTLDDSSVEVHWADPAFDRAIVSWEKENGEEMGRIESGGMTARIADLDPDESYSVVVRERTPGGIGRLISA